MKPFEFAKLICTDKTPWSELSEEDQKSWNTYMVNRFLSMNPEFVEIIDHIQLRSNMPPEMVYKVYCDLLPSRYSYYQFVKGGTRIRDIKAIALYFDVSRREARDYIPLIISEELYDDIRKKFDEEIVESHKIKKSKS